MTKQLEKHTKTVGVAVYIKLAIMRLDFFLSNRLNDTTVFSFTFGGKSVKILSDHQIEIRGQAFLHTVAPLNLTNMPYALIADDT